MEISLDLGYVLTFLLGIVMGGILFSKEFRKGFGQFMARTSKNLNK